MTFWEFLRYRFIEAGIGLGFVLLVGGVALGVWFVRARRRRRKARAGTAVKFESRATATVEKRKPGP